MPRQLAPPKEDRKSDPTQAEEVSDFVVGDGSSVNEHLVDGPDELEDDDDPKAPVRARE